MSLLRRIEEARILAGGQSLLALMKLRLVSPKALIDISGLKDLDYIKEREDGSVALGALTRHYQIEKSALVKTKYPFLSEAASQIGDPQTRNLGTIGGSLAHSDPSADLPPTILALNADLTTVGPKGQRTIKAEGFFIDFFTTALQRDEVLTEISLPPLPSRTGTAYQKFSRRHGDFAIVNVATIITVDGKNMCEAASVGLGGVGSTPMRAKSVEKELIGRKLDAERIAEASEKASEALKPPSDVHASADYRREICKVMTKRAMLVAFERAKSGHPA